MKIRSHMITKVICFIVVSAFLANEFCYGLGIQPGSTQSETKVAMYERAAQTLQLAYGKNPSINFDSVIPEFEGDDYKSQLPNVRFIKADPNNVPEEWKKSFFFKRLDDIKTNGKIDPIKAMKFYLVHEARIPEDRLEIRPGYNDVNEELGEVPFYECLRVENSPDDKYIAMPDIRYIQRLEHLFENDVWFEYTFPDGEKRIISIAWSLFFRPMKHEATDLRHDNGEPKGQGRGHFTRGSEGTPHLNEDLANQIDGRYGVINETPLLWFTRSYCYDAAVQYSNIDFHNNLMEFFNGKRSKELRLPEHFQNLKSSEDIEFAIKLACAINSEFFSRKGMRAVSSVIDPDLMKETENFRASLKTRGITEPSIFATGMNDQHKPISIEMIKGYIGKPENTLRALIRDLNIPVENVEKLDKGKMVEKLIRFFFKISPGDTIKFEGPKPLKDAIYAGIRGDSILLGLNEKKYSVNLDQLAGYSIIKVDKVAETLKPEVARIEPGYEPQRSETFVRPESPLRDRLDTLANAVDSGRGDGSSKLDELVRQMDGTTTKSGVRMTSQAAPVGRGVSPGAKFFATPNEIIAKGGMANGARLINPLTEKEQTTSHASLDAQTSGKESFSEEQDRKYIRGLFENLFGSNEQPDDELVEFFQKQDHAANKSNKDGAKNQYEFLKKNEVDWLFVVAYLRAMNGEMGDRDKAAFFIEKAAELLRTTDADISDHKIWDTTIFEMAVKALSVLIDDGHGTKDMKSMLQALKTNNSMKKALGWRAPVSSATSNVRMTSDLPANVRGEPRYLKTPEALPKSKAPVMTTQSDNSIVNDAIRWGAKIPSDKRVIEAINYKSYNYILLLLASDSANNGTEDITAVMITKDGRLNRTMNIGTRSGTVSDYTCLASFDGRFMVLSNCENGNSYKELCNIYDMGNPATSPILLEKPMWIRFNKARSYVVFARTEDYSANATRPNKIYVHDLYGTSPRDPMIVEDYGMINLETAPGSSVEARKIGIENDTKPELLVPVKTTSTQAVSTKIAQTDEERLQELLDTYARVEANLKNLAKASVKKPLGQESDVDRKLYNKTLSHLEDLKRQIEALKEKIDKAAVLPSDLIKDAGLSELHEQNAGALKDHSFIKSMFKYIIRTGLNKRAGDMQLSAAELENIYRTKSELGKNIVEIIALKSFRLTDDMRKAIKDVGKRDGQGEVRYREFEYAEYLTTLINAPADPGVKRIVLVDDNIRENVLNMVKDRPEAFRSARMLNISLPGNYYKMDKVDKTVLQAKFITIAILARLLERDSTPMVEALLRDMLKTCPGFNESSMASLIDALGVSDGDVAAMDVRALIERITNMLGKPIKLVEKIGREIRLMKAFWIAA